MCKQAVAQTIRVWMNQQTDEHKFLLTYAESPLVHARAGQLVLQFYLFLFRSVLTPQPPNLSDQIEYYPCQKS